ncbi:MAG: hypothetical protein QG649_172 [Patescibacteria group bacterium]|nr:hypothetical protein [Patescibacteria group bacterium]
MKTSKLALGAVVGAAIGVVAGVLAAPKSGKETREDLKRKAEDVRGKTADTRDDLIFKAEEAIDDIKSRVIQAVDSATSSKKK